MQKEFIVIFDTDTDDWIIKGDPQRNPADKDYLTLYEIMAGGLDMLENEREWN